MKRLKVRRLKGMTRFVRMVAGAIHGEVADRGACEAKRTARWLKNSKSFNGIMGGLEIIIGKIHGEGFPFVEESDAGH
ncbi:MAG: hypothetical protein L0H94_06410 [Nitrospira sp.]|nr:hypothetical protein [Nitrospira sp.]